MVVCWSAGQATGGRGKFVRLVVVEAIGAVDTGSSDNGTSVEPKVLTGGKFRKWIRNPQGEISLGSQGYRSK